MIKNVSNIGQMIMPTIAGNQAVSGKSDAYSSKRFSVGREESPENRRTDADTSADNISEKDTIKDDKNTIQGNEKADDKKLNGYTHKRAEEKTGEKKEFRESQNVEDNQNINILQENINPDIAANSCEEDVTNSKGQITQALNFYISEKSNSVTGDAVKSEQTKALQETEKRQLGIKTILPEKSNGQNGLKQIFEQISQAKANAVDLSKNQISQTGAEQLTNGKVEQVKSDNLISAAGKNGDTDKTENNDNVNSTTDQKKTQSEFTVGDKEKSYSQSSSDANRQQENDQDTNDLSLPEFAKTNNQLFNQITDNIRQTFQQVIAAADISLPERKESVKQVFEDNKIDIDQFISHSDINSVGKAANPIPEKVNPDIRSDNSNTDIISQINKQITESIHSSIMQQGGEKQVIVRLNPPELGKVVIKFSEQNNELTGTLEVSRAQTRTEIEQALPQIIRSLSESGINLRKIDVISTETRSSDNSSMREHLFGDNNSNNSNHDGYGNQSGAGDFGNSGFHQWFSNSIEYGRSYGYENQFAGSGSINVLA
jgi:flagellar hook-length control protein FliK